MVANPKLSFNIAKPAETKEPANKPKKLQLPAVSKLDEVEVESSLLSVDEKLMWRETVTVLSGMLLNAK